MLDAVIVGAGLAGLVAANRAAEAGARVLVLEKSPDTPNINNSRVATGALNLAHHSPDEPVASLVAAIAADTEGHADPALAAMLAETAGRGLGWLAENGACLVRRAVQDKLSWMLSPLRSFEPGLDWAGRGADVLLDKLAANLLRRGGELRRHAKATGLLTDGGAVAGLTAVVDGAVQEILAGSVILADGGFQANRDLLRQHITRDPDALLQRNTETGTGDGILMAAAIGARLVDMDRFYGHLQPRAALHNANLWPYPTLDSLTGGSILIDRAGQRRFDEGAGGILLSNLIAASDDPLGFSIVFDEAIWTTAGRDELVPANPRLEGAGGTLFRAASLVELAGQLGLPAAVLEQTVETYNRGLHTAELTPPRTPGRRFGVGRDSPHRTPARPVETAPFYAAPLCAGITVTTGGLLIDAATRVLAKSDQPIPGLYAIGSNAGGIEGGPAAGYIGGLAKAICTGLIAGEQVRRRTSAC
jgi:fumarate reductase flavoprotein subunit